MVVVVKIIIIIIIIIIIMAFINKLSCYKANCEITLHIKKSGENLKLHKVEKKLKS